MEDILKIFLCHQNLTFFNTAIYMYLEMFMSLNFLAFSLYYFNFILYKFLTNGLLNISVKFAVKKMK